MGSKYGGPWSRVPQTAHNCFAPLVCKRIPGLGPLFLRLLQRERRKFSSNRTEGLQRSIPCSPSRCSPSHPSLSSHSPTVSSVASPASLASGGIDLIVRGVGRAVGRAFRLDVDLLRPSRPLLVGIVRLQ